jgi:protein-S-isoprenylcysteine O-methyltransferase Ste14
MHFLLFLSLAITFPVLAHKGKLNRGAWAAIAIVSLLLFCLFAFSRVTANVLSLAMMISAGFAGSCLGSILAVCLYRAPHTAKAAK